MSRYRVEVVQDSAQAPHQVFEALADHPRLSRVFGVPVRRIRDGEDELNGVGSVRAMGIGPLRLEETVTDIVPDREIGYRITRGGGPVHNHRGKIEIAQSGTGARVTWTIEFDASLPAVGPALRFVLARVIQRGLRRLG